MVLIESNKPKKVLHFRYIHHVTLEDLRSHRQELEILLEEFTGGFRLLTDLTELDSMDRNCSAEIGKIMELCEAKGLETIVRVIPDPKKDIGLNILSMFHYSKKIHPIMCESLEEAAKILGL